MAQIFLNRGKRGNKEFFQNNARFIEPRYTYIHTNHIQMDDLIRKLFRENGHSNPTHTHTHSKLINYVPNLGDRRKYRNMMKLHRIQRRNILG